MKEVIKAVIYGDSVLRGVVFDPVTKRHSFAKGNAYNAIGEQFGIKIENKAHFGYTVREGRCDVMRDIASGEVYEYALLEFGGNDSDFRWDEIAKAPYARHTPKVGIDEFIKTMQNLIEKLRGCGTEPVLMSLPPILPGAYLTYLSSRGIDRNEVMKWLGDENTIYRHQELYSLALMRLSQKENIPLCDVRQAFLCKKDLSSLMCADGIHPNSRGQKLIACTFYDFIKRRAANNLI